MFFKLFSTEFFVLCAQFLKKEHLWVIGQVIADLYSRFLACNRHLSGQVIDKALVVVAFAHEEQELGGN
jgi:hypothetical protein